VATRRGPCEVRGRVASGRSVVAHLRHVFDAVVSEDTLGDPHPPSPVINGRTTASRWFGESRPSAASTRSSGSGNASAGPGPTSLPALRPSLSSPRHAEGHPPRSTAAGLRSPRPARAPARTPRRARRPRRLGRPRRRAASVRSLGTLPRAPTPRSPGSPAHTHQFSVGVLQRTSTSSLMRWPSREHGREMSAQLQEDAPRVGTPASQASGEECYRAEHARRGVAVIAATRKGMCGRLPEPMELRVPRPHEKKGPAGLLVPAVGASSRCATESSMKRPAPGFADCIPRRQRDWTGAMFSR
jgi:hypothetical protein